MSNEYVNIKGFAFMSSIFTKYIDKAKEGEVVKNAASYATVSELDAGNGKNNAETDVELTANVENPISSRSNNNLVQIESQFIELSFLEKVGLDIADLMQGSFAEDYRHIKRPLVNNARLPYKQGARNSNIILVTSAVPGEGKSFTAVNLAVSIAMEQDHKALLIDADFIQPTLTRAVGLEGRQGFIETLTQKDTTIADVIYKTELPDFRFIPAGAPHYRSNELVASEEMQLKLAEISKRYADRVIVLDSSPLLATSEAHVLASLVDQVVLVVEAEKTPRALVEEALAALKREDQFVALLFNKDKSTRRHRYYGYYHRPSGTR